MSHLEVFVRITEKVDWNLLNGHRNRGAGGKLPPNILPTKTIQEFKNDICISV